MKLTPRELYIPRIRAALHVALSTRLVSEYWLPFAIAACPPIYMVIVMIGTL